MTLAERARAWRAERRRAIISEAASFSAAGGIAFFGLAALVDRFAALPREVRVGALAVWAAWQAWVLATRLRRPWRALDWDAVFAAAAREWPRSRPMLASAWALREGPAAPGTSDELRAEHLARADRLAGELPADGLFVWSPSRGARRLAAAAVAVLAATAIWGDLASWVRVAAPWHDAALARWVDVTPGNASVDWGAPAVVLARTSSEARGAGVRAAALVFETRGVDGAWRAVPWTRADESEASWKTDALTAPLDYRVRWRDLTGPAYRLEPVAPPRWKRASAVVRDSRGEHSFILGDEASVRARRGDWVELSGEADAALSAAVLRVGSDAPIAMHQEGGVWKGGFPAVADATMIFELVAATGRRDPSPPAYALTVAADMPPTAELLSPQVPLVASPSDSIVVTWAARDDSAVTAASLVVNAGGHERVIPLAVPSPLRPEALGDYSWPLAGYGAGSHWEFWIEARDDASPPQIGRSDHGSIDIVDAEADHAAALASRDAADAAVERAATRAEAARDAARKGDIAASSAEQKNLRSEWAAARKALEDWAKRSASDPRGDSGLAEEAEQASEEFAAAGEEGLPAADKSLAESDAPSAAREQGALADQARGVQKSMREGAQAQAVQDFAGKMSRGAKSSDEMASAAEKMAARGKDGSVSSAELEKLEESLAEVEKSLDALRKAVEGLPEISPEEASGQSQDLPMDDAKSAAGEMRRALQNGDVAGAAKAAKKLADRLKKLAQTLSQAGQKAAQSHGQQGGRAATRVQKAWQAATEAQTAAAEAARKVEDGRQADLLKAQKELLRKISDDLDQAVSSRAASGAVPGALNSMKDAQKRLKNGDASSAALMMKDAAARMGGDKELNSLASKLESGPPSPSADAAGAQGAAAAQSSALARAQSLRSELSAAARNSGYLSGRLSRKVEAALSEEEAGHAALSRGDSGEGLKRAESALSILQEGAGEANS
ncbi:MAG: hypothetical protein ACHQ49_11060, partial [Elusimicrobiota bacterium]